MKDKKVFLVVGHELKEIMIDIDSRLWWIDGMIVSYHLTIENCLHLKHDYQNAVLAIVSKEFYGLERKQIIFK